MVHAGAGPPDSGPPRPTGLPRVLTVIGTRPEGIKLAPVIGALQERSGEVESRVVLTGQHTNLMDQVLEVFRLAPDWDLGIMREGQDLYDVTHQCLSGLRGVVNEYHPDLLVVEGDTASVFLGGLIAFFERKKVGHVEAGLRSGDKWRPWPEEIFRRLTGVLADLHFAPTPLARDNLLREGVSSSRIYVTGNTVVDALLATASRPHSPQNADLKWSRQSGRRMVLVTAHRRESFGEPLRRAFSALRDIAERFDDVVILYPVHPNPHVREAAAAMLSDHERIRLTEPLDYLDLVYALKNSSLVLTDSGGIQEEAPTFGVPVLVMREVTERPEGVEAAVAQLVGTEPAKILAAASEVLGAPADSRSREGNVEEAMPRPIAMTAGALRPVADAGSIRRALGADGHADLTRSPNPYGDGHAGERIADILVSELTGAARRTTDWPGWR